MGTSRTTRSTAQTLPRPRHPCPILRLENTGKKNPSRLKYPFELGVRYSVNPTEHNSPTETDTKHRILGAAVKLFSQRGYRSTSVAAICEQAKVNVAAVNYYFHSKLELYTQVWKVALEREAVSNPADGGVPEGAPAEERLKGRIRSLIHRFVRPNAPSELAMLIIHELAAPTDPAIDQIRFDAVQPPHAAMRALVREMLGDGATDRDVLFTTMGIFIPVVGLGLQQQSVYRRDRPSHEEGGSACLKLPGAEFRHAIEQENGFEALIDHFTMTSLAGIEAVRRNIESRGAP